ncbi:72a30d6d-7b05-45cb-95ed-aa2526159a2e [Sclerotinia trifoliorum]|uniref:72a30d6d-7b05-45cb-95ed-aa2526159a2e n=1 Tax=Sclerotinia trifoliorum TaxID=28548 RepID=A0A8H2ZKP3_9HELO|nr:72a30d6d-7b05-45cb-95ed-aa2526159a2e [Sclerotinia trifoliorum]
MLQSLLLSILATGLLVHATPVPAPTGVPTTSTANTELAALTVAAAGSQDVIKRDGTNVVVDTACAATSGNWVSPYDGAVWTSASDLDIDHLVPLSNAWKAGASAWTTDQRRTFANDLVNPQLLAPSLTTYWCTYAKMWIKVKYVYNLTITSDEKAALVTMMDTC